MTVSFAQLSSALRFLSVDMVERAKSGHPGMPLGIADVLTVLFSEYLSFDAAHPTWENRDRFILSAGHGSAVLYALGYLLGYEAVTLDQLRSFRQLGSKTAGHPEHDVAMGIETTTGPLGQGLGNAVGMAIAQQILASQIGNDLINHRTFVVAGDGCLMEGIGQEALSLAGHLKLNKLTVLFDDNHISIDGDTGLSCTDNHLQRFAACGWLTLSADGHNPDSIRVALNQAMQSELPTFIACRTTIGFGSTTKAGTAAVHGSPLGSADIQQMRSNFNWPYDPFVISDDIRDAWQKIGTRGMKKRQQWQMQFNALPDGAKKNLVPDNVDTAINAFKEEMIKSAPLMATRKASGMVLDIMSPLMRSLVGGSADLTGSNNTKAKTQQAFTPNNHSGTYIHYGVREHAMGAIMNGISLYGGFIPYGGTFLVFSDYMRPAIRLSALMHQGVIYVLTHDSIGLGEDGPTHQPIEHLTSLRAIPNLLVFRPADVVETAECWQIALNNRNRPSVLALSRQDLPTLRHKNVDATKNYSSFGGYVISGVENAKLTIVATGSEVSLAIDVQKSILKLGITADVVSMPSQELFLQQTQEYRQAVLPRNKPIIAIEAGSSLSWHRIVGDNGIIIGIDTFGVSAPADDAYQHFGLTVQHIADQIIDHGC